MQRFAPGDRVVAINTDISRPICMIEDEWKCLFDFPDGPLRSGVVYYVRAVHSGSGGHQGLLLCGMRVFREGYLMPWDSSRFRKVKEVGHPPLAVRKKRKEP